LTAARTAGAVAVCKDGRKRHETGVKDLKCTRREKGITLLKVQFGSEVFQRNELKKHVPFTTQPKFPEIFGKFSEPVASVRKFTVRSICYFQPVPGLTPISNSVRGYSARFKAC